MSGSTDPLLRHLQSVLSQWSPQGKVWVAFSGGADSTALLWLAKQVRFPAELRAIHVNHQLNPNADAWQTHCEAVCDQLAVPFYCRSVQIESSASLEQACRDARYRVFEQVLQPGDWLLTAHHADDQVETVLLNLLRGSGPRGLGGIPVTRPLGQGQVGRPLLEFSRDQLAGVVTASELAAIDDDSNRDCRISRNYLRHQIIPSLQRRWAGASNGIRRSAQLAQQADQLIEAQLAPLFDGMFCSTDRTLDLAALRGQSAALQSELLRAWLARLGLPLPHHRQLLNLLGQLAARADGQVLVSWPGCEVRRYRSRLYADSPLPVINPDWQKIWHGDKLLLPADAGQLSWRSAKADAAFPRVLVRFRAGGERIKPAGQSMSKSLKALFQESAIPPWQRTRTPLLYCADQLSAVGDHWQTEAFGEQLAQQQMQLIWERH